MALLENIIYDLRYDETELEVWHVGSLGPDPNSQCDHVHEQRSERPRGNRLANFNNTIDRELYSIESMKHRPRHSAEWCFSDVVRIECAIGSITPSCILIIIQSSNATPFQLAGRLYVYSMHPS